MTFNFNGTQANVNITGGIEANISTPGSDQTIIHLSTLGTGAVATAYTVPANKTLYIFGFRMDAGAATYTAELYESDGTTKICALITSGTSQSVGNSCPMASFAAGTAVKVLCDNGVGYGFWGLLVDN